MGRVVLWCCCSVRGLRYAVCEVRVRGVVVAVNSDKCGGRSLLVESGKTLVVVGDSLVLGSKAGDSKEEGFDRREGRSHDTKQETDRSKTGRPSFFFPSSPHPDTVTGRTP
jgi:hypothetical protein